MAKAPSLQKVWNKGPQRTRKLSTGHPVDAGEMGKTLRGVV